MKKYAIYDLVINNDISCAGRLLYHSYVQYQCIKISFMLAALYFNNDIDNMMCKLCVLYVTLRFVALRNIFPNHSFILTYLRKMSFVKAIYVMCLSSTD